MLLKDTFHGHGCSLWMWIKTHKNEWGGRKGRTTNRNCCKRILFYYYSSFSIEKQPTDGKRILDKKILFEL